MSSKNQLAQTKVVLQGMLQKVAATNKKNQKETRERLDYISSEIGELKQMVHALEKPIQEISEVKERLTVVEASVSKLRTYLNCTRKKLDSLESGNDDLNNGMRTNNLLFRSVPEEQN